MTMILDFVFRWAHVLFGVVWIGMLYYFNFVQGEYFKEATADAKADALKKLAPRALWWFRWGAMFTFLTGLILLETTGATRNMMGNPIIWIGALAGTFMFLNVWVVIWPAQKVVIGLKEGDVPSSAAKAGLASRTNTLLSGPMLFAMLGSMHPAVSQPISTVAFMACILIVIALEANGLFGKQGPMTSVKGVIHSSLGLTALMWVLLAYL
jgi:uncharacterized membrane protein